MSPIVHYFLKLAFICFSLSRWLSKNEHAHFRISTTRIIQALNRSDIPNYQISQKPFSTWHWDAKASAATSPLICGLRTKVSKSGNLNLHRQWLLLVFDDATIWYKNTLSFIQAKPFNKFQAWLKALMIGGKGFGKGTRSRWGSYKET